MRIYIASSWRNPYQPGIVEALRSKGHEVYDFRNPRPGDRGFHWSEIDPDYKNWQPAEYRAALAHPMAETGFKSDFDAMKWAEVFVGVAPFGRSTSLEMGWAAGAGKATILYLPEMLGEAELMVKMCDTICVNPEELLDALRKYAPPKTERQAIPFECNLCWDSPCPMSAPNRRFLPKMCPWAPEPTECEWKEV